MLVHSILCMFTPLPSVSQHALASSTHKGRGFLLCSGCSLNHFGDFLLQRAARLHSLSTGENGLPGSFDVCWRESLSKLRGVPLQRTSKTGNWTSLPGSTHFFECSCHPAHTYSGSFSFGLREWTITKLSRPFFSIEQSR